MKNIAIRTSRALGAAVKARRRELCWSQAKLGEQLHVHRSDSAVAVQATD